MPTALTPRKKRSLLQPALFCGEDEVESAQVPLLEYDMEAQPPKDTAPKEARPRPTFWIGLVMGFMLEMAIILFLQFNNVTVGHYSIKLSLNAPLQTKFLIGTVILHLFLRVLLESRTNGDQAAAVDSRSNFLSYCVGAGCGIYLAWALTFVVLKSL